MTTVTNNLDLPTGMRELEGVCPRPGCEAPVRWRVMWDEQRGAIPPGTPLCEGCAEDEEDHSPRPERLSILDALDRCGVHVPEYGTMTWDTWDDSHDLHLTTARRWIGSVKSGSGAGSGLFLHGSNGNGKTSLAVCCIRELLESGERPGRIWFTLSRQFLRDLGDAYKAGGADSLVRRAKGVKLLVLDEFGKEPPTDHSASILSEIIDQRRGGTLITSNHSLGELAARYSHVDSMEHLVSRLGPKKFQHCEFTGPDRRFL